MSLLEATHAQVVWISFITVISIFDCYMIIVTMDTLELVLILFDPTPYPVLWKSRYFECCLS